METFKMQQQVLCPLPNISEHVIYEWRHVREEIKLIVDIIIISITASYIFIISVSVDNNFCKDETFPDFHLDRGQL